MYHSSANYHKGISEENCQNDHLDERALVSEEGPGTKPEQLEYCIDSKEEQEHHLKTGMNLRRGDEVKRGEKSNYKEQMRITSHISMLE